ncbi:hypothetical protein B296_00038873 [Ensete ventricosum]|uniref:ABC1 atypical kinase-like domain-containing protein n=1 Tax=Ensete ventricosum TaxID=4639 RepID=A0A426YNK7_ENSVE|nr:hypothetical protein B296_00038873 [Ensete ventricosum]
MGAQRAHPCYFASGPRRWREDSNVSISSFKTIGHTIDDVAVLPPSSALGPLLTEMAVALSLPSLPSRARRHRPLLVPQRASRQRLRSALIEVRPVPAAKTKGGGSAGRGQYAMELAVETQAPATASAAPLSIIPTDRTDDMQAEVRALARAANATVYSPQILAAKYASQPLKASLNSRVLLRMMEIVTASGTFALKLAVDQRRGQLDQRKRQRAVELTKTLTRLGPTFVKIGQGLSTRPDICPPEYLEELSELQVSCSV